MEGFKSLQVKSKFNLNFSFFLNIRALHLVFIS